MRKTGISFTIVLAASLMLSGCGEVAELVLDDSWAIVEIRAGSPITTDNTITLSQSGDDKYSITYELDDQLDRMVWMRWVAVDADPAVEIVSDSVTIDYIAFERQSSS